MLSDRGPERRDEGRSNPDDFTLRVSSTWQSPFKCPVEGRSLPLPGGLQIAFDLPRGWQRYEIPAEDSRYLFMPPRGGASLLIGCGVMIPGATLEAIAASAPM